MLECKGMVSDMAHKPSLKPNIEMECQARVRKKLRRENWRYLSVSTS